MVDLGLLARRARRVSEWGRLRSASRVAGAIAVFTAVALRVSPNRGAVAGVALALLATAIALGWHSAEGARAVRAGLRLGAAPLAAALFTVAIDGWCDPDRAITVCGVGCLLAGLVAGGASAWVALRTQSARRLWVRGQASLVASLTTALGCAGLGLGSALAVLAAIVIGALVAWVPRASEH